MAIVDTINSMYENVGEVYDTITNVDLPTNKNIENIPSTIRKSYLDIMNNGIDTIYDNWEKVNGTGTSISLNNTEEAPMKIEYKGNTSQGDLPTGFQQVEYIESTGTQYIDTGFKANYNTRVVIDFIANQRSDAWLLGSRISYGESNYSVLLWNGGELRTDYKVGGQDMGAYVNTRYILDKNKNVSTLYQNGTQVSQITATYSEFNSNHNMYLFACNNNGSVSAMATAKIFSCKIYDNGKLIRDYIPCYRNSDNVIGLYDIVNNQFYTNQGTGTFTKGNNLPTPTNPQDIHVVSGDNYINVCGKNLIKYPYYQETLTKNGITWKSNSDGTITINGTATAQSVFYLLYNSWSFDSNNIFSQGTYTLNMENGSDNVFLAVNYYDENNANVFYRSYPNESTTFNITDKRSINMLRVVVAVNTTVDNLVVKPQIEKGSSASEFQPYQSASYEINLGKNLFDKSIANLNKGISTSTGNLYDDTNCFTTDFIEVETSGVYYTASGYSTIANRVYGAQYDSNKQYVGGIATNVGTKTFYISNANTKYIRLTGLSSEIDTYQLEKGSQATSYSPYFTPIELCKIGTYQDRIFKSSGKNLVDVSNLSNVLITPSTGVETEIQSWRATDYNDGLKPNTTYCVSWVSSSDYFQVAVIYYDENKNYLSGESLTTSGVYEKTFTTPSNFKYYRITYSVNVGGSSVTRNLIQIEQNTTRTTYEPYGKDWYLNKQIGKLVLDGSENWGRSGNTSESFFCGALAGVNIPFQAKMGTAVDSKCNYFAKGNSHSNAEVFDMYNGTDYYTAFALYLSTSRVTDVTTFKNWLASNNTTLYYVLYQPTYEKITGELLNQLEAIKNSYENQTNINQENNDLPFELEVGALEKY